MNFCLRAGPEGHEFFLFQGRVRGHELFCFRAGPESMNFCFRAGSEGMSFFVSGQGQRA
jgi:hypothetical protein